MLTRTVANGVAAIVAVTGIGGRTTRAVDIGIGAVFMDGITTDGVVALIMAVTMGVTRITITTIRTTIPTAQATTIIMAIRIFTTVAQAATRLLCPRILVALAL
jgi:hypothetical protein